MAVKPEAGFLLKHSVLKRTQSYRVFAVSRRISREELGLFIPDPHALEVLEGARERKTGFIAFSPPLAARPANSGSEMEVSFYPYFKLQHFPLHTPQPEILRKLTRRGIASHLELRALKHLRKSFNGNILHLDPQKGGGGKCSSAPAATRR